MSRVFIDGFEGGNTGLWDGYVPGADKVLVLRDDNAVFQAQGGNFLPPRVGNYVLYCPNGGSTYYLRYNFNRLGNPSSMGFKWRMQTSSPSTNNTSMYINNPSGLDIGFFQLYEGIFSYEVRSNVVYRSSVTLQAYTWHLIEIFIDLSTGAYTEDGNITMRIDGQTSTWTNVCTNYVAAAPNNLFGYINLLGNNGYIMYDDFALDSSELPGDGYIQAMWPTSVGSPSEWDGSTHPSGKVASLGEAGSIALMDNDYVYTIAANERDTYVMEDAPTMESVYCIQVCHRARREGNPQATNIRPYLQSGGSSYDYGDSKEIPLENFKTLYHVWETNPFAGGADWTDVTVDAINIGVQSLTA